MRDPRTSLKKIYEDYVKVVRSDNLLVTTQSDLKYDYKWFWFLGSSTFG
jgi:hypothetical protein